MIVKKLSLEIKLILNLKIILFNFVSSGNKPKTAQSGMKT